MLPFSSISERFEDVARYAAVYAVMLVFFIADVIAIPNPFDWVMSIPFLVIAIYYWALYRPTIMPAILVFALGFMVDILSGAPFALNAMIFVLLQWAVSDHRVFIAAQGFVMVWLIFGVVYSGLIILQWFVNGLINLSWMSVTQIFPQIAVALIMFPLIMMILHFIHKILPNMKMSLSSRELH